MNRREFAETLVAGVAGVVVTAMPGSKVLEDDIREKIILRDENGEVLCAGVVVGTTIDNGTACDEIELPLLIRTTMRRPDKEFPSSARDAGLLRIITSGLHCEADRLSK